jgi:hypothetical protein
MGLGQRHRRVEPGIRDAGDSDAPVVVRHVLDQPVDRIPRVTVLIDVLVALLVGIVRAHIHELALAHVASPHVLENEDVTLLDEIGADLCLSARIPT